MYLEMNLQDWNVNELEVEREKVQMKPSYCYRFLPQVVAKNGGQNKYIERLTLFLHENLWPDPLEIVIVHVF